MTFRSFSTGRAGKTAACWPLASLLPLLLLILALGACTPRVAGLGPAVTTPALEGQSLRMADGARLALHEWRPEGPPRAVLLGLHGLNDTARNFLAESAPPLVAGGLLIQAYDQRGHAGNEPRGVWPGTEALVSDAVSAIRLLRAQHPDLPFYVLGESMGSNIALQAAERLRADPAAPRVDGWLLLVPGLWGLDDMNPITALSFRAALHSFPSLAVGSGSPSMIPTDNEDALARFNADPQTIKDTRVDVVWGLLQLTEATVPLVARCCAGPTLFLYGAKDGVIEQRPTKAALRTLPADAPARVALYRDGWHILLRDLQREVVARDILAFTADPRAPLPSGAERDGAAWLASPP
ncbi:alpha/beta hydrolase [Roseomonas sp. OT10]|uniref:alpha/beta fold hydrolase n=1 Tax=Roseomonas cutis TaxID=2897332 RepID=UPI001E578E9F|nr:alpha/beta fold hydrolase [Roseomonas sp. OT10]UFN49033.1 alpha/beta hydrolase [Roseomonas sp. OT10]